MTAPTAESPVSPRRRMLGIILHDPAAILGLAIVVLLVVCALFAPWLAPQDPDSIGTEINASPSGEHLLGTDDVGRDLLSRVIFGARVSFRAAFQIVGQALLVALPLGLFAGYVGGAADRLLMRVMDGLFAFPPIVLALTVAALLGPSLTNATIAIAVVFVPSLVRLIRGQVLAVREETYIEASRAVGVTTRRMLLRHILPNIAPPVIVQVALMLGFALLAEAGLSFLGFGVQPPTASWGVMLRRSFDFIFSSPWQIFIPGGAIMIAVLGFNLVGDGLRDALGRERVGLEGRSGSEPAPPATAISDVRVVGPRSASPIDEPGAGEGGTQPALVIRDLRVDLATPVGSLRVVDGVDLEVAAGEVLGVVGESGCGKTVTALAAMGLLDPRCSRISGSVRLAGDELVGRSPRALRQVQGRRMGMVFQEPASSLNPAFKVGDQIGEVLRVHEGTSRRAAAEQAVELLARVGIPEPRARSTSYPHELSGGMQQRVMLAMALACDPEVLIADEPTTALDVTVQAQILDLFRDLQRSHDLAIVLVTHDLGVVAEMADHVAVMYAGQVVEHAGVDDIFIRPQHPYTQGLLESLPQTTEPGERLPAIPGGVPSPGAMPPGCRFEPRCPHAVDSCATDAPTVVAVTATSVRCVRAGELELRGSS